MHSQAQQLAAHFRALPDPIAAITEAWSRLSVTERAALEYDWRFWRRPKQVIDPAGPWRTYGLCTGRGFGKTRTFCEFVQGEVQAGRAMRIALIAQSEDECKAVMVNGESGLIARSPPWFKAKWISVHGGGGRVLWPNGAQAFVYTPEAPKNLRGPEHHLAWASEMVAWNRLHREYAWDMMEYGVRLGYGRIIWDTTPKGKHPMIRALLRKSEKYPDLHPVIRGSMYENSANLAPGRVDELREKYKGTQREAEELDGLETWDDDDILWHLEWIKDNRRPMPDRLARRIVSIDPATTAHKGSDDTGLAELGLGLDDQAYVIADHTGRMPWEVWGALSVELHVDGNCDCTVIERNKIGDAGVANIRSHAKERKINVRVLRPDERAAPYRQCGAICVREVTARQSKAERAGPVAGLYKQGRVSHVEDADLAELDNLLTEWEPAPGVPSPNALDAVVHGICELVDVDAERPDNRAQMGGIVAVQRELKNENRRRTMPLIPRAPGRGGGRI